MRKTSAVAVVLMNLISVASFASSSTDMAKVLTSQVVAQIEAQPRIILNKVTSMGMTSGCLDGFQAQNFQLEFIQDVPNAPYGVMKVCTANIALVQDVQTRCDDSNKSPLPAVGDVILHGNSISPDYACVTTPPKRHK